MSNVQQNPNQKKTQDEQYSSQSGKSATAGQQGREQEKSVSKNADQTRQGGMKGEALDTENSRNNEEGSNSESSKSKY